MRLITESPAPGASDAGPDPGLRPGGVEADGSDPAGSDPQSRLPKKGVENGRHRSHQRPARDRRVLLRLSEEEHAVLAEAAGRSGLSAAGFAAEVALAAARGEAVPAHRELRELLVELVAARTQVRRYGVNVNRAVAQLQATGEAPGWLVRAAAGAQRGVARLDDVADQVGALLRRRSRR